MNKIHKFLTTAVIALAGVVGCSKNNSQSPSMQAYIGSTSFNMNDCYAGAGVTSTELHITGITANGSTSGPPSIDITIPQWTGTTGTFYIASIYPSTDSAYADYATTMTNVDRSNGGSVIITSVSSSAIKGTFSFTCASGTSITYGTFYAKRI